MNVEFLFALAIALFVLRLTFFVYLHTEFPRCSVLRSAVSDYGTGGAQKSCSATGFCRSRRTFFAMIFRAFASAKPLRLTIFWRSKFSVSSRFYSFRLISPARKSAPSRASSAGYLRSRTPKAHVFCLTRRRFCRPRRWPCAPFFAPSRGGDFSRIRESSCVSHPACAKILA